MGRSNDAETGDRSAVGNEAPKTPFFIRFVRAMRVAKVPHEFGSDVFSLLTLICEQQDVVFGRPVDFYTEQLCERVGIPVTSLKRFRKAVNTAVEAGWLRVTRRENGDRRPWIYEVVIPSTARLNDEYVEVSDFTLGKTLRVNPGQNAHPEQLTGCQINQGAEPTLSKTPTDPGQNAHGPWAKCPSNPGQNAHPSSPSISNPISSNPISSIPTNSGDGVGSVLEMKDSNSTLGNTLRVDPELSILADLSDFGLTAPRAILNEALNRGVTPERIAKLIEVAKLPGKAFDSDVNKWQIKPESLGWRIKQDVDSASVYECWVDYAQSLIDRATGRPDTRQFRKNGSYTKPSSTEFDESSKELRRQKHAAAIYQERKPACN